MMARRIIGAIALSALLPTMMAAGGGGRDYGNARFHYRITIPNTFGPFSEADNGDGGKASSRLGDARLSVWGAPFLDGDFSDEAAARLQADAAEGWRIFYARTTPAFAVFSAMRGTRILYQRGMPGCPDEAIFVRIEYESRARKAMDTVIDGLTRSFKRGGNCDRH